MFRMGFKTALFAKKKLAPSGVGLFRGGWNDSGATLNLTQRYDMATDGVVSGTNLQSQLADFAGTGNTALGIFAGGRAALNGVGNSVYKYQYSNNSTSTGTTLGTARWGLTGFSHDTAAIFAHGSNGSNTYTTLSVTELYTYSSNTRVAGTNLLETYAQSSAVGNKTAATFMGGRTDFGWKGTSTRYTFADNTVVAGGSMTGRSRAAGMGSNTTGYIIGGQLSSGAPVNYRTTVNLTTHAASTSTAASASDMARAGHAAASNTTKAILAGGVTSGDVLLNSSSKFTYSGLVFVAGTSLSTARRDLAASCSASAHLIS